MGTPAMTTRGFQPPDFARVADIVDAAVGITQKVDRAAKQEAEARGVGEKSAAGLKAFFGFVGNGTGEGEGLKEVRELRGEVESWVGGFGEPWLEGEKEGKA